MLFFFMLCCLLAFAVVDANGNEQTPAVNSDSSQADTSVPPAGTSDEAKPEPKVFPEEVVTALRRENATHRTKLHETESELQKLRDAQKSEAERLQEKAQKADELTAQNAALTEERDSFKAALTEEVEAKKKTLPKDLADLLPEGSPVEQLAWLRKAEKLKPAADLPQSGGRNPQSGANGQKVPSQDERKASLQTTAGRF